MPPGKLFADAEGTRAAIMKATYQALCRHGYADLTIQRIADEFPKSKSLLYHHYEGKDEILLEFLDYLLTHFKETVPKRDYEDPHTHLQEIVRRVVPTDLTDEKKDFTRAVIELRAQAANDQRYHDHFTRSDEFFRERIASVVRRGVEQGRYRDVDPERVADYLLTLIDGAMHRRVTSDIDVERIRRETQVYIDSLRSKDEG